MEFVPVILGANITSYGLARAFHEKYAIKSIVLSSEDGKYISSSKIITNIIRPDLDDPEKFVAALHEIEAMHSPGTALIALASGDTNARLLIENRDRLTRFVIPYIGEELLNTIVFKDNFYGFCERLSIPYPKTVVLGSEGYDPGELPFPYPVVMKPSDSSAFKGLSFAGKKKVYVPKTREEMLTSIREAREAGYTGTFVIQDFIPGDDTNLYVLTCYCDADSEVVFSALGRVLLEDPTPEAMGNHVAIINETNPKVVEDAARFLKHTGYTGYANFDIKYDMRDGTYKFFEINVRLGRSNYYITGSGYNAVEWIVDDLLLHKPLVPTVASSERLYTNVFRFLLMAMMKNKTQKDRAKRLFKEKKAFNPLIYKADKSAKRDAYVFLALANYVRKFWRYR